MQSARSWLLSSLALIAACAAGSQKPVGTSINDPPDAAAPAPSDAGLLQIQPEGGKEDPGASQGEDAGPVAIDPEAVKSAVNKSGEAAGDAPLGLRFEVAELGADKPWVMALVNRGTEPALVTFDPRLLSFDVDLPEKPDAKTKKPTKNAKPPKPHECRLPPEVVPANAEDEGRVKLEPGDGLVQNFDPRLYCLPTAKQTWLVPGAKLTPRFGWPLKVKVVYKNGKRVESTENQQPPFVAEPAEAEGSLPSGAPADAEKDAETSAERSKPAPASTKGKGKSSEPAEPDHRVKELVGTPIELGSEFAPKPKESDDSPLTLKVHGSDALDEDASTVSVTLRNRSKSKLDVYFRRELVSFEVAGPDGVSTCDPEPDARSPDRQAFTTLRPGGEISAVSRLMEMCPAHTFARPGLYRVTARFDSTIDGSQFGLHAFTGRVTASDAALVRIRRGPLPFQGSGPAEHVHIGTEKH